MLSNFFRDGITGFLRDKMGINLTRQVKYGSVENTRPRLVSVVCGFPKSLDECAYTPGKFGDDSWFKASTVDADVLGVADGVGGWRSYGVNSGDFSSFLMQSCKRLVNNGRFHPKNAQKLIAYSYNELLEQKRPILGSSTACIVMLNRENRKIYSASIGDSGFIVVRKGAIVYRSTMQQHHFNMPFQLGAFPPDYPNHILHDTPDSAATLNFSVQNGDVILLATDGLFDNVHEIILVEILSKVEGTDNPVQLQMAVNTIALLARLLSFNKRFMSPFALNAYFNNIRILGGKPDDITIFLATVVM